MLKKENPNTSPSIILAKFKGGNTKSSDARIKTSMNLVDSARHRAGNYQTLFNNRIVKLILASQNQKIIERFLIKDQDRYRLNTVWPDGFNAGHYKSGDRVTLYQQLSLELAKQNQADGSMEANNPGMVKSSVMVDIGNGILIPIERNTARRLADEGLLPRRTIDLPDQPGWTREDLDFHSYIAGLRFRYASINGQLQY